MESREKSVTKGGRSEITLLCRELNTNQWNQREGYLKIFSRKETWNHIRDKNLKWKSRVWDYSLDDKSTQRVWTRGIRNQNGWVFCLFISFFWWGAGRIFGLSYVLNGEDTEQILRSGISENGGTWI